MESVALRMPSLVNISPLKHFFVSFPSMTQYSFSLSCDETLIMKGEMSLLQMLDNFCLPDVQDQPSESITLTN